MASKRNTAKKSYTPPFFKELDASAAMAELKARGDPKDPTVRQMLSWIEEQVDQRKDQSQPWALFGYDRFEIVLVVIVLACAVTVAIAYLLAQQ